MKNYASLYIVLSMAAALTAGCAALNKESSDVLDSVQNEQTSMDNIQHIVARGDLLSDIALRYTGQASRWEAIAAYNDITDPLTLRIGDSLTIPASMIPDHKRQTTATVLSSTDRNSPGAGSTGTASTGTLALQRTREASNSDNEAEDVLVAPVAINRTFELNPIEASSLSTTYRNDTNPPQIRVIGSYYPKGIYQQPASYSKLIMRVAPGTILELDQEVNDWYKVVTDEGFGYLRTVDGKLISD